MAECKESSGQTEEIDPRVARCFPHCCGVCILLPEDKRPSVQEDPERAPCLELLEAAE